MKCKVTENKAKKEEEELISRFLPYSEGLENYKWESKWVYL